MLSIIGCHDEGPRMRDLQEGDNIIARLIDARLGQGSRNNLSTNRYPRRDQITRRITAATKSTPNLHGPATAFRRDYVAAIPVKRFRNED
jgi:hypothetical protein